MQVRTDGIRQETLLYRRHGLYPRESAAPMAHVEENAPLLRGKDKGLYFSSAIHHRLPVLISIGIGMRKDVTRPHMLHEQGLDGIRRVMLAKIHHHRHMRQLSASNGRVHLCEVTPIMG